MFELMLIEIFVNAAILCLILFVVAKHEADYSFPKVAMTTAGIGLGSFVLQVFLFEKLGWYTLILVFAFSAFMIKTFCWLNLKKTIIVILIFCSFQVATKFGIHYLSEYLAPPTLPPSQSEQAYEVAKEMGLIDPGGPPPQNPEPPKPLMAAPKPPQKDNKKSLLSKLKKPFSKTETKVKEIIPDSWEEARKQLKHEGTMLNSSGEYVAIVNGEILDIGDIIRYSTEATTYSWKVTEISKHNLSFKKLKAKPIKKESIPK